MSVYARSTSGISRLFSTLHLHADAFMSFVANPIHWSFQRRLGSRPEDPRSGVGNFRATQKNPTASEEDLIQR